MDEPPQPSEETFVIEDVATLKALADPLRLRLLIETADEPRTVKQLAASLAVPQTRLYYHVRLLQDHRLLRVAGRRVVSGIEERSYQAVAKNWTAAPSVMSALVKTGVLSAMLDLAGAELELALTEDPNIGDPSGPVPVLSLTHLVLSLEDVEEVQRRIASVMVDFGGEPFSGEKPGYQGLFAVCRLRGRGARPASTAGSAKGRPRRRRSKTA